MAIAAICRSWCTSSSLLVGQHLAKPTLITRYMYELLSGKRASRASEEQPPHCDPRHG